MVRTVTKSTKDAIIDAAHGVRTMAGEALGAATKAAADVVFVSTANALDTGRSKLRRATPAMKNALGNAARRSVAKRGPARRKPRKAATAQKRAAKRKAPSRKKTTRRAAKRRRSR